MVEIEIGRRNPLPIPPNFVSLRQLRDRRLTEAQAQPQNAPLDRSSREEKSDKRPFLPSLDRSSTEKKKSDKRSIQPPRDRSSTEKKSDKWPILPPLDRSSTEEESDKRPFLPPNYVSLRQLQERHLKEQREKEREKEDVEKENDRVKEKEEEEEKGENYSLLPPNYVSLRQLRELRLKEKEEKQKKEAEEKAEKTTLLEIKEQEKGDEAGQIDRKAGNLASNPQSKKPYKLGYMKSGCVWRPVLRPDGTSTGTGAVSDDAVFVPETGASGEVVVALSDQNGDAEMKHKHKKKKKKKEQNKKRTSGKKKGEVEVRNGSEGARKVTGSKIGEVVTASEAMEVVRGTRIKDTTGKNGKGKNVSSIESSSWSIPARAEAKALDGPQAVGFKIRTGRDKGKGKEVNLKEQSDIVVPVSDVAEGSHGAQEVIGSKIVNVGEKKGKGKKVNMPESSYQTPIVKEAKGFNGAGEVVRLEFESGKQEKGKGENVTAPESSKGKAPVGGDGGRKRTAGVRGRRDPRAGRFAWRAEHLRGSDLVWVLKKSS